MYEQQIARGMAILDEARPGWREEINVDRLDFLLTGRCILGQVFGELTVGLAQLRMAGSAAAWANGFAPRDAEPAAFAEAADMLAAEWRQALAGAS